MRPGSLNLDLSAKEPSEYQNSSAETGRRSDQCLRPGLDGRGGGGGAANYQSFRADKRIWKRNGGAYKGRKAGEGGGFELVMAKRGEERAPVLHVNNTWPWRLWLRHNLSPILFFCLFRMQRNKSCKPFNFLRRSFEFV